MKKMQYDNTEVVVISSKPSSERKRYTADYMEKVGQSSKKVLKALEEIQEKHPNKRAK
ncbi:hypothetical protein WKH56_08040 [Priestia sp. SB1]|uniref:Uncharacterized protein n=1 Tax=Priestia aryabhattai TaxID=412384 RepID=A0AAX6NEM3_PRIAR|nr:hypothetical protein [Priestia aryabhattai]MDU9694110.1 hypothetical protein [Priestia aryabhattai]NGY88596.1 hypothetical protein [Priestia megaterium]